MMDDEPTLGDLIRDIWNARLFVAGGGLLAFACALVFIMMATPLYRAVMIIAPADGYVLGDYASQVPYDKMLTLPFWRPTDPEGISTDYYRFIHTVRGPTSAAILLKDKLILNNVRKDTSWNNQKPDWGAEELSLYLSKKITIEPLGATPLRRITYDHPDREFAAAFLRKIHLVADQMIRRDRRRQAESRVEYLENALDETRHPDHRKGITNLLMQQEHMRMLANMNESYAAIVVEPPATGPRPHWPNTALILPISVLIGMMLGYIVATIRRDHG